MKIQVHAHELSGIPENYALINPKDAKKHDFQPSETIEIDEYKQAFYLIFNDSVPSNTLLLHPKFMNDLNLNEGNQITIQTVSLTTYNQLIHKKIKQQTFSKTEVMEFLEGIKYDYLRPTQIASFGTAVEIHRLDTAETTYFAEGFYNESKKLNLYGTVVDKHSIGGIAGNRVTPIIVSIIAAAGLSIPKVSTRAITSPAGTIDAVEQVMNVDFSIEETNEIVRKVGGCIVNGETVGLGSLADKFIKVLKQVKLDPRELMVASILAKKAAAGSKYVLIDLPTGKGSKLPSKNQARSLAHDFALIGHKLGLKVESVISPGDKPIGSMIGPALEMKEALMILEGEKPSSSLRRKALSLSGIILEMASVADPGTGINLAREYLTSGKALKKFREIVEAQGGDPNISSDQIPDAPYTETIYATRNDVVYNIESSDVGMIARAAGAPFDKEAGIVLFVDRGDEIKKGDKLFEIHASSSAKLEEALKVAHDNPPIELEKMILEHLKGITVDDEEL